jgi:serine/threonine-protein kinase
MIGDRLGPWIIEEEIGRGGMGAVYRARRAGDAPPGAAAAAVKVLAAELAVEVGFQQRFQREIDILRQLSHPGIVALYDSGSDQDRFWFAMEYIAGPSYENLREAGGGRIPWKDVLELACQLAPALKHAHDRGIIHRDLKPSNLLLDESSGHAKLTDFGIASLFASPHLTVTGGVIGTPEYLSPEQAAGKPVTKKSDLYSFGVVLYTLVTGNTPFVGDPIDLLHKHRYGQFDRPGRIVPDLHPDFDEIICKLLEKDPAARPGDGMVLFRQLDSLKKKIDRQSQSEAVDTTAQKKPSGAREGPATMVSRLVRQELIEQNQPGRVGRVLNNPLVLVLLFVLCVGTLVWTFWPAGPDALYQRGTALLASDNPADWERAWSEYLEPLERKYPDHAYKEEIAQLRKDYADRVEEQNAERSARTKRAMSEGQWFYEKGLRLRRRGQEKEARQVWEALARAYENVPSEKPWVRRARAALDEKDRADDADAWRTVREALRRAKALEEEGKKEEAQAIRQGLAELYSGDPAAKGVLERP